MQPPTGAGSPLSATDRDFFTFDDGLLPSGLSRAIVPLAVMPNGGPEAVGLGTAFVIGGFPSGDWLLLTALHNLDDKIIEGVDRIIAFFPRDDTPEGLRDLRAFWVVGASLAQSGSDISLLVARLDDSVAPPNRVVIDLSQPRVTENCLAIGYPAITLGQPIGLKVDAFVQASTSRGKIEEVHPTRRDSVKITFPAFRTDALYPSGMSGGPVLGGGVGAPGEMRPVGVLGVVSSCMVSTEDEVPHTSYCALIAAAMELEIPQGVDRAGDKLAQLCADGAVEAVGPPTTLARDLNRLTITWAT